MEYISIFLTAFKEIADRVRNLDKKRLQDKQDLFNEIVKPLFAELEPVALNYIDFFRKTRQAILNGSQKDFRKTRSNIRKDREAMLMSRIKIRAMADQIKQHVNDNDVVEFASAVKNFFYAAASEHLASEELMSSAAYRLFKAINSSLEAQRIKHYIDNLERIINSDIEYLEESWGTIVKCYEKIKILSVSPPQYIHKSVAKKKKSQ